jgi:hypothetical protein
MVAAPSAESLVKWVFSTHGVVAAAGGAEITVKNGRISDAITTLRTRIPHCFKSILDI